MRRVLLKTVQCRNCGIEIKTYSYKRLYCDDCRKQREKERAHERYQQRVGIMKTKKNLRKCIKEANERGLSYGHYMAWKEEEKRKTMQAGKEKEKGNERD